MKKITLSLAIILAVVLTACTGTDGRDGLDGLDGLIGTTYEITVDLDETYRYSFPTEIVNGDAVLVYRLEAIDTGLDVWQPLPTATKFFVGGEYLQYGFNYTIGDLDLFLESDINNFTDDEYDDYVLNQTFRIVIVPSDLIAEVDTTNLTTVMAQLGLEETSFKNIN